MSLSDWESDLTDIESSSEEEYLPTKRKPGRPPQPPKEYRITNALSAPRATNYSTKHIHDLLVAGSIDLDPQYQRDVVWPEGKQMGLIDSLMRNYYVPPIIFGTGGIVITFLPPIDPRSIAVKKDPKTSEETRVCIDGKQRLTSLRRFIDGEIAHKDSDTGKKYFFGRSSKPGRAMLPLALTGSFLMKQIVCMEYEEIDEEQEREIFQRVQMGMALTVAERMQAISGPWPDLIREVQAVTIGEEGFGGALDWGTGRGRDFQCLVTIVYLTTDKVIFPGSQQLEKWLARTAPVPSKLRIDILETFRIFVYLAREPKFSRCFQKPTRISPVEFIMTGYAIYTLREQLSFSQLSSAIAKMREDVRVKHADIRANKKVMTTMHTFLRNITKDPSFLKKDKDDTAASDAIKHIAHKPAKRKRTEAQMDDDAEEQPKRVTLSKTAIAKATEANKIKTKTTATKVTKSVTSKETGTRTTVKKVPVSAPTSKPFPSTSKISSSASHTSTAAKAFPAAFKPASAASSTTPQTSISDTTQQSFKTKVPDGMGPPAIPRKAPRDGMDLNLPAGPAAPASAERQSPQSHHTTPTSDALQSTNVASSQSSATPTPPPIPIKPDPDNEHPRVGGIVDRLAPIRNAKSSAPSSPELPSQLSSPSRSLFAQHQQQFLQQQGGALSPPATTQGTEQDHPRLLPRTSSDPTFQHNAARQTTPSTPTPQITAAAVQSLLARAGFQGSPKLLATSPQNADTLHDSRRRPSVSTPMQSPTLPFATSAPKPPSAPASAPASANGSATHASQSPPAAPTTPGHAPQPAQPSPSRSLSPTLPRRPEASPKADVGKPMLATRMSPESVRGPEC
ncbi:uncharacterized protein PHACADRAFT_213209 [Phanerochaete carnosa HHB-10118-sp]|uniref:GmrSD restriction endonucleases N-terminal domain-containing protein n=1 Tax=Phanerochaete carnosa (strain HHB-10118-sp) TaxID=650164 RepID=K5WM73_PHACS|nr:uncharacterized protein PHACADRAFT_213209 [Phanerochaete carnosa HHB-10118-sp]EKM51372.1 hypothetical protein PHACADRAFT_213209 [Phanerochaete carnosa HHB-10118-sp]